MKNASKREPNDFFMTEYMEKGEDGLPVKMDNDPEVTDENYKEKV